HAGALGHLAQGGGAQPLLGDDGQRGLDQFATARIAAQALGTPGRLGLGRIGGMRHRAAMLLCVRIVRPVSDAASIPARQARPRATRRRRVAAPRPAEVPRRRWPALGPRSRTPPPYPSPFFPARIREGSARGAGGASAPPCGPNRVRTTKKT